MLNDLGPDKFKQALIDFDKDNIPESIIKLVDPICDQDDFTPEAIAKVSVACEAMCMWAQAMRTYYYVAKEVEPKRIALAAATSKLGEKLEQMGLSRDQISEEPVVTYIAAGGSDYYYYY